MSRRQTVILEMGGTTSAAGLLTLRTNRLRAGQTLAVQVVSFRSEDADKVYAEVGIERGSTFSRIETVYVEHKDRTYNCHRQVWVESDAQLRIDFSTEEGASSIYAWVFGYLQDDL